MKTRDIDIRKCLHENLNKIHNYSDDTIIVDELSLCQGDARIDIAVVNGTFHGYEIKSESDTLDRLPNQIEVYSKVLDIITIVTGKNHLDNILSIIPEWWGIDIAENIENKIVIHNIRDGSSNPHQDSYSIAQLLWKEEALDILRQFELEKGLISKPRKKVWEKLAISFPIEDLKYYVREKIKCRSNWRVDKSHMLSDDL